MTKLTASTLFALIALCSRVSAQNPLQHPLVAIEEPNGGGPANIGQDFVIRGSALNSDYLHVWAWPASGPVWLGAVGMPGAPDAMRQLTGGVWTLKVTNAPLGNYAIVVYAHEASSNTFPTQATLSVQVHTCSWVTINWPYMGITGPTTVNLPYCG